MKSPKFAKFLLSVLLITAPILAKANVIYPALDVQNFNSQGDTGPAYVSGVSFDADSTAFAIVYDDGTPSIALPETDFDLSSTFSGGGLYAGTISAGSLLSGSFSDLTITYNGNVFGTDFWAFSANVTYTGGSLSTGISGGMMVGNFDSLGNFTAKVGEVAVIPVPAAVWLFASGLLGLVGVARRS